MYVMWLHGRGIIVIHILEPIGQNFSILSIPVSKFVLQINMRSINIKDDNAFYDSDAIGTYLDSFYICFTPQRLKSALDAESINNNTNTNIFLLLFLFIYFLLHDGRVVN